MTCFKGMIFGFSISLLSGFFCHAMEQPQGRPPQDESATSTALTVPSLDGRGGGLPAVTEPGVDSQEVTGNAPWPPTAIMPASPSSSRRIRAYSSTPVTRMLVLGRPMWMPNSRSEGSIDPCADRHMPYMLVPGDRYFDVSRPLVCATGDTKIILSIDGGGSRGIIPLYYLLAAENAIHNGHIEVDMIAGTSVGAIIGASVALRGERRLYDNFGGFARDVFTKNYVSFAGFTQPVYNSSGRLRQIEGFVGDTWGRDLPVPFLVPFYSLHTREAIVYTNYGKRDDFRLRDLLMMSSAAPTYFDPHSCVSSTGDQYEGCDGGMFANHPGVIAYLAARTQYPGSRIVMISLGTGRANSCPAPNYHHGRGLIFWAGAFAEIAVDASSFHAHVILSAESSTDSSFDYIRIQPALEKELMITDGTSDEHLAKLQSAARASIGDGGSERAKFEQLTHILHDRQRRL